MFYIFIEPVFVHYNSVGFCGSGFQLTVDNHVNKIFIILNIFKFQVSHSIIHVIFEFDIIEIFFLYGLFFIHMFLFSSYIYWYVFMIWNRLLKRLHLSVEFWIMLSMIVSLFWSILVISFLFSILIELVLINSLNLFCSCVGFYIYVYISNNYIIFTWV